MMKTQLGKSSMADNILY